MLDQGNLKKGFDISNFIFWKGRILIVIEDSNGCIFGGFFKILAKESIDHFLCFVSQKKLNKEKNE